MKTIKVLLFVSMTIASAVPAFAQNIERMFQTDVKIYLQQTGAAPGGASDLGLRPVERTVPADFKLEYALQALFEEELSDDEVEEGFVSSTYGMRFDGVSLKKGVATVRFSQPADAETKMFMPVTFIAAITKTARQFRSVRDVTICAAGRTTVKDAMEKPFPRCPSIR